MLVSCPNSSCLPHGYIPLIDLDSFEQLDFDEAWGMFVKVCGGEMILEGSLRLMPLQVGGTNNCIAYIRIVGCPCLRWLRTRARLH